MSKMFYNCKSLTKINLSKSFDTKNVINMSNMFNKCKSLTEIDLSNFNTKNVINMSNMFNECESLTKINLSSFDTKNVTNMSYMFSRCKCLTEINLSKFNTKNVTNMSSMFNECESLIKINLSYFDINNDTDMSYMFYNCKSLTEITNLNTINVPEEKKKYMYYGCEKLFEEEQRKYIKDYNENNEKFSLKKLTQYNLYPKKENTDSSNINQLLIICKKIINPFINNNEYFNTKIKSEKKEIESKLNEIGEKYDKPKDNLLLSNISFLNVTQVLENNYNFSFKLKNAITNSAKIFNFNEYDRTLLFILFHLDSPGSIKKIKEIKKYENEVANNNDKKFELIAMIRENSNQDFQEKLKSNDLDFCWLISENIDSNFIKLFGFDDVINSRCVFINKNSEISLILEDSIEYLTKEMIDFYLGRKSEIAKLDPYGFFQNKQQILELKTIYENL